MIFGAATLVAVGAAAFFLFQTEQQIASRRSTLRAFDLRAREATTVLADLRVAQQAYVAEGQGVDFWMPKVASLHESITEYAGRAAAVTGERWSEQGARRGRRHGGRVLAISTGARAITSPATRSRWPPTSSLPRAAKRWRTPRARLRRRASPSTRQRTLPKRRCGRRRRFAAGAAASFAALVVLLLIPRPRVEVEEPVTTGLSISPTRRAAASVPTTAVPAKAPKAAPAAPRAQAETNVATRHAIALKAAASLATDFGRVRDAEEMTRSSAGPRR